MAAEVVLQKLAELILGDVDVVALERAFELRLALDDVLVAALLLEPRAYLRASVISLYLFEPFTVGTLVGVLCRDYLAYLTRLQLVVERHNLAVDLRAYCLVTYLRVYAVGEVDDGRAHGQVDRHTLGGHDYDVLGSKVGLDYADYLLDVVGGLLCLYDLTHPRETALHLVLAAYALLVLPVGGDTVFRGLVHIPRAYLHLEGDALLTEYGGVQ